MPTTDELQQEITALKESLGDLAQRHADLSAAFTDERTLSHRLIDEATPAGTIVARGGGTYADVPQGWLPCDGRALSSAAHPQLFAAIRTAWGNGDGTEGSFSLPDLRGLFLRGLSAESNADPERDTRTDNIPGLPPRNGANKGDRVGSLQASATALPVSQPFATGNESNPHNHNATTNAQHQGGPNSFDSGDERGVSPVGSVSVGNNNQSHTHEVNRGGDRETRPINAYVVWMIKDDERFG